MGRGRISVFSSLAAFTVLGAFTTWTRYPSPSYPYSISYPSTFTHLGMRDISDRYNVDFWFPSLGTHTTNMNVFARPVPKVRQSEVQYLRSFGGKNIRKVGSIRIAGQRLDLIGADFKTIYKYYWREEGVTFVACKRWWHVTISYDLKYRSLRPTLFRMLTSFRLNC
jgi:hypothetical protein